MKLKEYFENLEKQVKKVYKVAEKAKEKGLDPKPEVEVPLATSLAGRVAGLIYTLYPQLKNDKFVNRILELEKEHGSLDPVVCLRIAEETAKEKFCKFENLEQGIDAGIRVAIAYQTLGVVSSPLEGYTEFKIEKTKDGKDYFSPYYSGPIRSAGGTAAAFSLVIVDYLREIFGYEKYDPQEKEIKRAVTELYDYHERITNLQYLPTEKEIEYLFKHLPVQINGDPSSVREVSNYKDLERVETNFIRSGFCLVLGEGISQKAPKILRMIHKLREKGFKLSGWDWFDDFVEFQKKEQQGKGASKGGAAVYIKDLVAGRPVLGHPSRQGGFRLRYGRARNTGYSCLAISPATMAILNGFIAIGSQLKIELPTKGTAIASCDSIEGPIVRLRNGSVRKVKDKEEGKRLFDSVEEIIYLGDILVPFGDFVNRNHKLVKPGYCEQEWYQQLKKKTVENNVDVEIQNIYEISLEKARDISRKFQIPLYPQFIFYWSQISYEDFLSLIDWLNHSRYDKKLILPYNNTEQERFKQGKRVLEILGVEQEVATENVLVDKEESEAFLTNLGIDKNNFRHDIDFLSEKIKKFHEDKHEEEVLKIINHLSEFEIIDKAGTFIGSRMGRPEKAKLRKLVGSPNVLFPVGKEGGRMRSINEACNVGHIKSDFPIFYCQNCKKETIYPKCEKCGKETKKMYYCYFCKEKMFTSYCPKHDKCNEYENKKIDILELFNNSYKTLNLLPSEIPRLIKGVRGTSNKNHVPENLTKGFLRALFNLQVNKDGTIRVDGTELPITHFKPKEVGTSINKLKEMGYEKDVYKKDLENEEQILEIFPHDVILPSCPDSVEEKSEVIFSRAANFIDLLLMRFYNLESFYNIKTREDLVGHLLACLAPHNCAGVVGRIIGFSKTQSILASPYFHGAMRRDCDGDEAAVMLLSDLLINFSKEYLPAHRGGTQDTPLVLNMRIRAGEVDDMVFDIDILKELPLELYEKARQGKEPKDVEIEQIIHRLGKGEEKEFTNLWYEYEVSDINGGILCSSYKKLATMQEKVQKQMELAEKIRAAETSDVARLIIDRHFIRDIRGNLRKFSQQVFRCSKCNEKYRRPPLSGICSKCNGRIIFTISHGSIIKYLEPAIQLADKYHIPAYVSQSLALTRRYIESIFGREKEKQEALQKWF